MLKIALPITFPEKNLSGKICLSPFRVVKIDLDGTVRLCGCTGWMPTSIGNVYDNPLTELLSSEIARKIRQSIIDGSYIFCNQDTCGVMRNNQLNTVDNMPDEVRWQIQDASRYLMPNELYISGDLTCNLSCPSCRTKIIKLSAQQIKEKEKYISILKNNIFSNSTDQEINLHVSSTGELFASSNLLSLIGGISAEDFPNLKLCIVTNGLLAEQNWTKLGDLQNRVRQICVTIDAAQADTYEKLRRGGTWSKIMESMTWLQQKKKQNNMELYTRMVVQKDNYKEVEDFYKLSLSFDADRIEYARVSDWNTMSQQQFTEIDVLNPDHPLHQDALYYWSRIKDFPNVLSWG